MRPSSPFARPADGPAHQRPAMSELSDRLRRITVTTRSPSQAVEATLSTHDGMSVRLGSRGVGGHTEKSFAAEAQAALAAALRGHTTAVQQVLADSAGAPTPPAETAHSAGGRKQQFSEAMSAVQVRGESPHGLIVVTRSGNGAVDVEICPGTLRRLRDEQLTAQFNAALTQASQRMKEALVQLHRDVYTPTSRQRGVRT